ncbi:non-ribosomal peptide synthetase [Mycobacterium sp.]|uniref:non-ribosomal peptide synthetase n=1 Tax=Mycobacterium sp. TaxID=1785 RepID=UPI003D14720A
MTEIHSVGRRSRAAPLPLSVSLRRLWHLCQLAPDSPACNELVTMRKSGPLDVEALRRALSDVVARHEMWRTTIASVDGVPHQVVREPAEVELPLVDLTHLKLEDAVCRAAEIAAADALRPYDLAEGPLIRPRLIRITDDDHRLQLGLHQLVFDGTTLRRVIFPELTALYRSYETGVPLSLPEPPAQYADYTMWELDRVQGPEAAGRITRWRSKLAGSTPSQLPVDHPPPPDRSFTGGIIPITIDRGTVEGLRRAARGADGTLSHVIAAAHAWWLHLYADSTDVIFGTAHDLRDREDLRAVVGNCETPMVLRYLVKGDESFITLVSRTRQAVAEAIADVLPFDTLVAELGVPRDPLNDNLFQTMLHFRSPVTFATGEWSLRMVDADVRDAVGSATFDISIEVEERTNGQVVGGLIFSTDLFDRETAREMASLWCRLLGAVAADPELPMAEHDLVTPEERQRQLSWNRITAEGSSPQCVHEVVGLQVERTPDAVAVQVGDVTMTYRQLDDRAAVIASRLVQAGAGPGTVVALLLDRTPDVVAAILGVLKSGAAFLPLDPRQPGTRNAFCINDVGASIVLTDRGALVGGHATTAAVIDLGDLAQDEPNMRASSGTVSWADLAYVICTSGSTGQPKPVLIEHLGATNLMRTLSREFGVDAGDTVLSVASISFDMALFDIFCALACGARLVLAAAADAVNPASLNALIAKSGATYMMATPTTWRALVAAGWHGDHRLRATAGGETLTDGLAEALLQRCGAVWNGYGPTETTAGTSVARLAEGDVVTVGRPLPNVRAYITDSRGRLQPIGVPGEIAIGGVGVGRGYLNRPEEQARRFGDDPFHVGGRIYRTGDRGRFLPDGRIQHLGRYDDQLKIRGFRIEPGEIESILCGHSAVAACAVVARELPNSEQHLVAYIVGEPGRLTDTEARSWLRRRLPEYMVPSAFVHLRALPVTAHGKLDKAALPAPPPLGPGSGSAQSPRTDTEKRVAALWADLLGTPVNDISSDFFDLGGHSLLAARLISEAELTFGVKLSLASFIDEGRVVAKFAELLSAQSPVGTDEVKSYPPLHFIFSDAGSAMSLRHFVEQWGDRQPVHAVILEQPGGLFDRAVTIEEHARQALSTIRKRQPDGPLVLVGYSIGGLVAYEVARQALDAGQHIDWLGIVDAVAPPLHEWKRAELTLRWRLRALRRRSARERWAKCAEVMLRMLQRPSAWRQREFDNRGAADIACRYQRPAHRAPMHLFVSEASVASAGQDLLGWSGFHKGPLLGHRFAGDHFSLLQLPQAELLATIMLESLFKSRESTGGQPATTLQRTHASARYRPWGADAATVDSAK